MTITTFSSETDNVIAMFNEHRMNKIRLHFTKKVDYNKTICNIEHYVWFHSLVGMSLMT